LKTTELNHTSRIVHLHNVQNTNSFRYCLVMEECAFSMKSAFRFLLKFIEKRSTTFVHKVPRLIEYPGLHKCWAPPGKVLLYTGKFAIRLLLTLVRSISVRRQVTVSVRNFMDKCCKFKSHYVAVFKQRVFRRVVSRCDYSEGSLC
jgi:hypothetical protein